MLVPQAAEHLPDRRTVPFLPAARDAAKVPAPCSRALDGRAGWTSSTAASRSALVRRGQNRSGTGTVSSTCTFKISVQIVNFFANFWRQLPFFVCFYQGSGNFVEFVRHFSQHSRPAFACLSDSWMASASPRGRKENAFSFTMLRPRD